MKSTNKGAKICKKYSADFETLTCLEDRTWVWAWAICSIDDSFKFEYGGSIETFIEWCKGHTGSKIYFHNLKFDGEFILSYLLNIGFKYIEDKRQRDSETFSTLITDMGQFYTIEVYFEVKGKNVKKVTFIDSLKILPMKVSKIAKSFNLEEQKLEIDYKKYRKPNQILSKQEIDYIKNDVTIVAKALYFLFNENMTKLTTASNALANYKEIFTKRKFEANFPILENEIDSLLRKSYKGGFTFLNDYYKEKIVNNGIVLDVNSLYPSVMYYDYLPYGKPIFYERRI